MRYRPGRGPRQGEQLLTTSESQAFRHRTLSSDGKAHDDTVDSMLDFMFVANGAREWRAEATVVVRDGDFPDDGQMSDHLPTRCAMAPIGQASR